MEEKSSLNWEQLYPLSLSDDSMVKSGECVFSNQDLLTEILLHVPARSLMCLQLVSKQWLSLIISKSFSLLHTRRSRCGTSAIFLQSQQFGMRLTNEVKFLNLNLDFDDKKKHHNKLSKKNPFRNSIFSHDPSNPDNVCILQSCHGLLLCRTGGSLSRNNRRRLYYYIYNPTTNQVTTIDRNWDGNTTIDRCVLVFDPDKSTHYKVVFCVNITPQVLDHQHIQFEVYLSETRTWKVSAQPPFITHYGLIMDAFAYFKGCIYWTSRRGDMDFILYYNVDEERIARLPRPPCKVFEGCIIRRRIYFGESAGHLHLAETFPGPATSLDIYELKCDRSGWFVKYKVDLTQLSQDFPEMTGNKRYFPNEYAFAVQCLRRRENTDEDSVVVLEIPDKYIAYNLVDQTWKVVLKFSHAEKVGDWLCGAYRGFDYIESLAYV